jgi:hypothetical protein
MTTEAMVAEKPKKDGGPGYAARGHGLLNDHISDAVRRSAGSACLAVALQPAPLSLRRNESGQAGTSESGYCRAMSLIRPLDSIACIFPTNE